MLDLYDFFHTLSETLSEMVDLYDVFRILFYMVKNLVRAPTNYTHIYFLLIVIFSKKGRTFYNLQIMNFFVNLFDLLVYKPAKEILIELLKLLLFMAIFVTNIKICQYLL
jgi:hypothetical protein